VLFVGEHKPALVALAPLDLPICIGYGAANTGNHEAVDVLRRWGYAGPIEVMPQMGVDRSLFYPPPY